MPYELESVSPPAVLLVEALVPPLVPSVSPPPLPLVETLVPPVPKRPSIKMSLPPTLVSESLPLPANMLTLVPLEL
ncbi:MAG TPA: hypothetical protein PK867_00780, partial [Pirellulales bacterium]|nr:hypothetical protein [Pirellulales bacterium]